MAGEETTDPQTLVDQLTRQVNDLTGRLASAEGERDGFRAKFRTATHKQAFADRALKAKADPKAVEALWKLSGYQPEADEIDPEAIDALVKAAKEDSPFAFLKDAPAPPPADPKAPPPQLRVPLDDGKGGKVATPGKFQVRRSELSDGRWMHANQDRVMAAQRDGSFELID